MFNQEFYDNIIKKLGDDYKNVSGNYIGYDDYSLDEETEKNIPLVRVEEDRNACINYVDEQLNKKTDIYEKEIILVMYSNFFIRYGMASRFKSENQYSEFDGLESILNNTIKHKNHLKKVYLTAKYQDDASWNDILKYNPSSVVSKMYKFVKFCCEYSHDVSQKIEIQSIDLNNYQEMWELYESLPLYAQKYIICENTQNTNHAISNKLLPYMDFTSYKEMTSEYISTYYKSLLNTLRIPYGIDPDNAFSEIISAINLDALLKAQIDLAEYYTSNPENPEDGYNLFHKLLSGFGEFFTQFCNIQQPLNFITEKIHYLLDENSLISYWLKSSKLLDEYNWDGMNPAMNCAYLHIPVQVNIKKSLFESQFEVYIKNRTLKRNSDQKKEMMDYYAHSWKHISYPSIVKDIAKELESSNQSLSNRLMKVYNSERTLQMGIQLLQYISSGDDKRVCEEFKKSMAVPNSKDPRSISLVQVINDSLDIVVFKILMSESDDSISVQKCRDKWNKISPLSTLCQNYTDKFILSLNNTNRIVDWVSKNFLKINLCIDTIWSGIRFLNDGFAINQFKEILVEIFTNAFLHGKDYINIEFSSNSSELIINADNPSDSNSNTKSGLSSLGKLINHLNYGTDINGMCYTNDKIFKLTIRINKKIMIMRCL